MNILITGASGFIGRHLGQFLAKNHNVFGTTRSVSGIANAAITPVVVDLSDHQFADHLPINIDCIVHLAQSARYRDFPEGVDDMKKINIDATISLLEWARMSRVKHFIFSSSANVYAQSTAAITELDPTQPSSFYGASKLAAEHLARQYQNYFQVDILRCFTVYGRDQKGMLIPNIMERIITGKLITLAQGVGIYLSPIHVNDVVDVIGKLVTAPLAKQSRLMNLCGDQIISLNDIIRILEKITEKPAIIQMTDDDVIHFVGSNVRLKSYLNLYQFIDIFSGLEVTAHSAKKIH